MARAVLHIIGGQRLAAAIALTAVINVLALTGPAYTLLIFERVLPAGGELLAASALMLALYAASALVDFARQRLIARCVRHLDRAIGVMAARRLTATPRREIASLRAFLGGQAPAALCDLPWAPLYLLTLLLLHPLFCLLALLGAASIAASILLIDGGTAQQPLSLARAGAPRRRAQEASACRAMLAAAILRALRPALQSATLGLGAHLVMMGACFPAAPLAAAIVLARFVSPIEVSMAHWRCLADACASAGRLASLLGAASASRRVLGQAPPCATEARPLRIVLRRSRDYARNTSRGAATAASSGLRPTAQ